IRELILPCWRWPRPRWHHLQTPAARRSRRRWVRGVAAAARSRLPDQLAGWRSGRRVAAAALALLRWRPWPRPESIPAFLARPAFSLVVRPYWLPVRFRLAPPS